jgi:hypothetical protein
MEVMGLMLGDFVDEYTVRVVDVFAMPQSGTGVSVEAVDPVFQTNMMDMLKQTGRFVFFLEPNLRLVNRDCVRTNALAHADRKPWWAGITHIQVLAAGCRPSISTPNSRSSNLLLAP